MVGDFFGELFGGGEVGGEGFEVAVINADEVGSEVEGGFHFGEVVDFDEDVELDFFGDFVEFGELVFFEGGDDEEDGVSAGDAGFVDLAFVAGEVFTEEGDGGDFRDVDEVGEVALEVFFIGEDGHAGGSAVDVSFGLAEGVEIGIDDAGGGGGFFDFGDDAELVWAAI